MTTKNGVCQALAAAEDRAATATAEAFAAMNKLDTEQTAMADALIEASERVAAAEERARRAQEATVLGGHRLSVSFCLCPPQWEVALRFNTVGMDRGVWNVVQSKEGPEMRGGGRGETIDVDEVQRLRKERRWRRIRVAAEVRVALASAEGKEI